MSPSRRPESSIDDPRLLRAAQTYAAELEAGRRPERGEFVARFPEIGAALAPFLDALDVFHAPAAPSAAAPAAATATAHAPIAVPADGAISAEALGDFRIVREIGRGGMGTVYEAVQLSLGRRVALKVLPFAAALDAKHLQRFKNEAQAAAHLHHTNIVPVYAVGCERGVHYYAMQLIEGQNLADLIRCMRPPDATALQGAPTAGPVEAPALSVTAAAAAAALSTQRAARSGAYYATAARLTIQAADALEHAHQLGVIHRDIKPANLMVDAVGNLWVADFGLAQFHTGGGLTRTGDLLGTLRYMSPEQAGGQGVAPDPRTDIYSLGATLYELLVLEPMFDGDGHHSLLKQILNDEPRPLRAVDRAVPAELETIVLKAVSKNPDDRYRSAAAFADDLRRFVDHRPILARRPTVPQRVRNWARRHPAVVVAAAVLLVLVAAGSLVSAALIRGAYQRERQRAEDAEAQFRLAQRAVDEMIELSNDELAANPQLQGLRQRVLMSAIAYYQEFIDRRQDDPAAQEELRETHARVEKILGDLAVIKGAGRMPLMRHPAVQKDLGLSAEQGAAIAELLEQGRAAMGRVGKIAPEERQRRFIEQAHAQDTKINAILTPAQNRRLWQIALQSQGLAALRDPDVIAGLKLTAKQRERIRVIEMDMFFGPPDAKRFGAPPGDFRQMHEQRQRAALARALATLTPEQARAWQGTIGPRFDGSLSFFGPMPFPHEHGPPRRPGPPPA